MLFVLSGACIQEEARPLASKFKAGRVSISSYGRVDSGEVIAVNGSASFGTRRREQVGWAHAMESVARRAA